MKTDDDYKENSLSKDYVKNLPGHRGSLKGMNLLDLMNLKGSKEPPPIDVTKLKGYRPRVGVKPIWAVAL